MSALSAREIGSLLVHEDPKKRLVVSPLLDPKEQLKPSQAGVDVRLGRIFTMSRPWMQGVGELLNAEGSAIPSPDTVVLEYGQPLIIHPHQFVLARTLEFVRLPDNLLAYVIGRSSWGRRGLIVATAVVVHPGFAGPITLELKNVGEIPIALYPLDRIAQLTFHDVTRGGGDESIPSQFTSSFIPGYGAVRDPETRRRIAHMASLREDSNP